MKDLRQILPNDVEQLFGLWVLFELKKCSKYYQNKIISAFPGVGKTFFHNKHKETTLDSDSSEFSWTITKEYNGGDGNEGYGYHDIKVKNPNFPKNYIEHIKENIGKYEYIFVSSHKEVREALYDNCIFFYLVYPEENRKDEFIQRYKNRGNNETFIRLVESKWKDWLTEIFFEDSGSQKIRMVLPNLEDELRHLNIIEHSGDRLI